MAAAGGYATQRQADKHLREWRTAADGMGWHGMDGRRRGGGVAFGGGVSAARGNDAARKMSWLKVKVVLGGADVGA